MELNFNSWQLKFNSHQVVELIFKSWVAVEGRVGKLGIRRVLRSFVWDRPVSGRVTGDILELGNYIFITWN